MNNRIFVNNISKDKFFTKKKITMLSLGAIIFIVAIILSFIFLKINIQSILDMFINTIKKNPIVIIAFLYVFLFPAFRYINNILVFVKPRVKRLGLLISNTEYFFLFLKLWIINIITPFASGSDPYLIYWLKSRGLDFKDANVISVIGALMYCISEVIITIPSFIYISFFYYQITNTYASLIIYWFIVGGILANIVMLCSYFMIGYSRRIHYCISLTFNWFLKKIKKQALSKNEIKRKYIVDSEFKKKFLFELKQYQLNVIMCLSNIIVNILYYITLFGCLLSIGAIEFDLFNFWILLNISNVSITANNFIPIPGAEGSLQITLVCLSTVFDINYLIPSSSNIDFVVSQGIGLWRILTNYLPLIFSIVMVCFYYCYKIVFIFFKKDKSKYENKNEINFSFVVVINKNSQWIKRCLNSIFKYKKNTEIVIVYYTIPNSILNFIDKNKLQHNVKMINIKTFNNKNVWNNILNKVSSDYLLFINSNDYINCEYLYKLSNDINYKNIDMLTNPQLINKINKITQWSENNFVANSDLTNYLIHNHFSLYGTMFNKSFLVKNKKLVKQYNLWTDNLNNYSKLICQLNEFYHAHNFFYCHQKSNTNKINKKFLKEILEYNLKIYNEYCNDENVNLVQYNKKYFKWLFKKIY